MKHVSDIIRPLPALLVAGALLASCGRSDQEPPSTADPRGSTSVGGLAGNDTATTRDSAGRSPADAPSISDRKYGLQSGIIRFRNSVLNREQIFYFDQYGKREALYDVIPPGAAEGESPYVAIIQVDNARQMFDLRSRRGSKRKSENEPGAILGTIPDVWKTIPISPKARRTEELPPREILGKPTEGYGFQETGQAGSYKVWIWNQIPLYAEIQLTEEPLIFEAVSIEENVPIPQGIFTAPRDVVLALE